MVAKMKEFIKQNEARIVLVFGFILVAIVSFEAGVVKGSKISQNEVKIEQKVLGMDSSQENASRASNLPSETPKDSANINGAAQKCAYVGSKNSNKYHLPTCQFAKRIKPENITCFKDENEAKLKGYLPDKGCIK
jgi:hypothetical protein